MKKENKTRPRCVKQQGRVRPTEQRYISRIEGITTEEYDRAQQNRELRKVEGTLKERNGRNIERERNWNQHPILLTKREDRDDCADAKENQINFNEIALANGAADDQSQGKPNYGGQNHRHAWAN